jgi:hypothetical protein
LTHPVLLKVKARLVSQTFEPRKRSDKNLVSILLRFGAARLYCVLRRYNPYERRMQLWEAYS